MSGNDAEVHPFVRVCYSGYSMYFGWTMYIIEGALLTFGAFLAWESRHVSQFFSLNLLFETVQSGPLHSYKCFFALERSKLFILICYDCSWCCALWWP